MEPVYGLKNLTGRQHTRPDVFTWSPDRVAAVREADRQEFEVIRKLPLLWYVFERVFDAMMTPSRRKNAAGYARSIALASGQSFWSPEYVDAKVQRLAALEFQEFPDRSLWESNAQYIADIVTPGRAKVNIGSMDYHGTVEFRHMGGTLNGKLITHWIRLLHDVFRWAATPGQSPPVRWYSGELALTAFWRTLGGVSLEQRNYWRSRIRTLGYLSQPEEHE